jgi:transcriptional regulator with XRE-family HTH domain
MARAALGLGVRELALLARVSPDTIARLERGEDLRERTLQVVRAALQNAGVDFIEENGGGAGVRLSKPSLQQDTARTEPQSPKAVDEE